MSQGLLFAPTRSRSLPLVKGSWLVGVDAVDPEPRNPGCGRCSLGKGAKNACVGGLGDRGGVLVVFGSPRKVDDAEGAPVPSGTVASIRRALEKAGVEARYVFAMGCPGEPGVGEMASCRPYLASEVDAAQRVVALGDVAGKMLTGRAVPVRELRRAWAFVRGKPTLFVMDPVDAMRNHILRKRLSEDLAWALGFEPEPIRGAVRVLLEDEEVEAYFDGLNRSDDISVDVEHKGKLWSAKFEMLCVGVCQDPEDPVVIPHDVLSRPRPLAAFRRVMENPAYPKVGQNFKHDTNAIWRAYGFELSGVEADSMHWSRQLDSDCRARLEVISWRVGMGGYKEIVKDDGDDDEEDDGGFGSKDPDVLHLYNGRDTSSTWRLVRHQRPRMGRFLRTWRDLIQPSQWALGIVERWGAHLSGPNVETFHKWLTQRQEEETRSLKKYKEADGLEFSNDHHVRELLFQRLGLPSLQQTKSGLASVADDALKAIQSQHPIVHHVREWRRYEKQVTTYGLPILRHVGYDGRVHCSYRIVRTGRLAASRPNMQNVTKPHEDGDEGTWARGCWTAPEGHMLVSLDYSQAELRVAAMLSGDMVLAGVFESGRDLHRATASLIFGVEYDAVTDAQRSIAKNINFGLVYGQTSWGLSFVLGCPEETARKYMEKLFGAYKQLAAWMRKGQADARVYGETWSEHWNWVYRRDNWMAGEEGDDKSARRRFKGAMNKARNSPVQTIANCFSVASLIEIVSWIVENDLPIRLTITVHDALILEVPVAMVPMVARKCREVMMSWPSGIVEMKVDVEVGEDWGHMKKFQI